jgi:FkbM family methyltransferase
MTTRIVSTLVATGDVVIDVGANIGWYSVLAARLVGATGAVIAIEPDPTNFELLTHNTSEFTQVAALPLALADRAGSLQLTQSASNLGDHRLAAPHQGAAVNTRQKISVDVSTLDDLIAQQAVQIELLRLIKLDTQGAETLIFRGANGLLNQLPNRCALVVELAPNLLRHHGPEHVEELIALMERIGRPLFMVRKRTLKRTNAAQLRTIARKCEGLGDEIAIDVLIPPASSGEQQRLRRAARKEMFTRR